MVKKLIAAALCLITILAAFSVTAAAESYSKLEIKVGDVKLYADKESVQVGEMVTVTVYLENVTNSEGILTFDWPLTYDKSKLSFIRMEEIFPASWGPYGEFLGAATPDIEDPWMLRLVNEAGDLLDNKAYRITADKQMGFKLVFKAVAEGDAFVSVDDHPAHALMMVVYDGKDVYNYGGNGMKLTIKIGAEDDSSAVVPPVESDDSSEDDVREPVDESSADLSVDDSSEDVSADVSSEEPTSEDVSEEESSVQNESSADLSSEAPSADVSGEESSQDAASEEQSEAAVDNNKKEDSSDFPWLPIVIGVVAFAIAGVGAFFYIRKSKSEN